jgi:uncharacterized cupin superfamily protein
VTLVHWDEIEGVRRAKGEIDATAQRLGAAAGAVGVGVSRVRVEPGMLPTPPHSHGASEELYFVLGGAGLAWQDEAAHDLRPGDCVVHRADEHEHTFRAGPDGLEYLVFGTNHPTEYGWLPRSRAIRLAGPGSRAVRTIRGTSRLRRSRSRSASPDSGRTTSSTSTPSTRKRRPASCGRGSERRAGRGRRA